MKRTIFFLLLNTIGYHSVAQDVSRRHINSPTQDSSSPINGFGGITLELSRLRGQPSLSVGGGGAALFSNRFFLGGFGQRTVSDVPIQVGAVKYGLRVNQGGLWVGYRTNSNHRVQGYVDTRLGWTNIGVVNANGPTTAVTYRRNGFMATPTVGAQITVLPFMRVSASGGYRFAANVDVTLSDGRGQTNRLSNQDFAGPVAALSVIFGGF